MKNCKEFHPLIVAAARREPVSAELEEHLEACPECCVALANQRSLTAALGAMAKSAPVAPPAIQAALLAELRSQTNLAPAISTSRPINLPHWIPTLPSRARKQAVLATAAIAAAVALALFWPESQTPAPPQIARVVPPPPPVVEQSKPAPQPVRQLPARAKRRKAPRPVSTAPAPEPQPEVATDFYPVPYTEPLRPTQRADIYRVQVPRATMAAFGIPVIGGRLDSQITADVIVGEDGVTRAVRFIRQ